MNTRLLLLTTAAALSCSFALLRAEDAPKPPSPGGSGGPGGPGGGPGGEGFASRLDEIFNRMDANGDGKVSKEEYLEYTKKEAEERFSKMDTNGTGSLDKQQVGEALRRMMQGRNGGGQGQGRNAEGFRRPDGDGSGFRPRPASSPDENAANGQTSGNSAGQPGQGPGGPGGGPGGPGGGGGGGGRRGMGGGSYGEMFQIIREKGSISKEDYLKISEEQFKRIDADGDGKITSEELQDALRKMGGRGGQGGQGGGPGGPGGQGGQGGGQGFRPPPPAN